MSAAAQASLVVLAAVVVFVSGVWLGGWWRSDQEARPAARSEEEVPVSDDTAELLIPLPAQFAALRTQLADVAEDVTKIDRDIRDLTTLTDEGFDAVMTALGRLRPAETGEDVT